MSVIEAQIEFDRQINYRIQRILNSDYGGITKVFMTNRIAILKLDWSYKLNLDIRKCRLTR